MATTTTTNYGFVKPDKDEFIGPDNFNDNFDNLDTVLKAVSDKANEAASKTVTVDATPTDGSNNPVSSNGVYDAITDINSRFNTHTHKKSQITDMPTKLSQFTNNKGFKKISWTTVTIASSAWSSLKATVSIADVTADNAIDVCPAPPQDNIDIWTKAQMYASAQSAGTLTFACKTAPTAAVTVNVKCTTKA